MLVLGIQQNADRCNSVKSSQTMTHMGCGAITKGEVGSYHCCHGARVERHSAVHSPENQAAGFSSKRHKVAMHPVLCGSAEVAVPTQCTINLLNHHLSVSFKETTEKAKTLLRVILPSAPDAFSSGNRNYPRWEALSKSVKTLHLRLGWQTTCLKGLKPFS
eukprot:162369-Pelagomonas_calceolata.AAC.6